MEISFCDRKLEQAINGEKDGSYSVLNKIMKKNRIKCKLEDIMQAYGMLEAAKNIGDILPSYRFHGLSGNHSGEYAISIDARHRILFKIIDTSISRDRLLDAQKIEITNIGLDYHE